MVAFIGDQLRLEAVHSSGKFAAVPPGSDLYSAMFLRDAASAAVGTASASRIACGATDVLELALRGEQGALLFSSLQPDNITVYQHGALQQEVRFCGNQYPETAFLSKYYGGLWLYPCFIFIFTQADDPLRPNLHGLATAKFVE